MSKKTAETKTASEVITSETEIKDSVAPNLHKKVQTAEGWRRSVKRMRKSSRTASKG